MNLEYIAHYLLQEILLREQAHRNHWMRIVLCSATPCHNDGSMKNSDNLLSIEVLIEYRGVCYIYQEEHN